MKGESLLREVFVANRHLGWKPRMECPSTCYVDLIINGRTIQALVDSGASHNFLWKELASELGLRVGPCVLSIKVGQF
jgi:hypothetical protein